MFTTDFDQNNVDCAKFTKFFSEINFTQVINAESLHVVMSMYNLIEHIDEYEKASGSL